MVLPILPMRTRRSFCLSVCSCQSISKTLFLFRLFLLPSLLPELASGTLVNGLRIPGRMRCGLTVAEVAAVISPRGGMCDAYSSAKLIRFFAHISAMPSMACWNSGQSAERKMSAKAYAVTGGNGWMASSRAPGALNVIPVVPEYALTSTGEVIACGVVARLRLFRLLCLRMSRVGLRTGQSCQPQIFQTAFLQTHSSPKSSPAGTFPYDIDNGIYRGA